MKIAIALLLGAASSHAALNKEEVLALTSKMKNKTPSMNDKVNALREAAGYLKRKEALPSKLKDRLSRRAVDDGDDDLPACMSSCDMDFQSQADITDFCGSKCWNSCPSCKTALLELQQAEVAENPFPALAAIDTCQVRL